MIRYFFGSQHTAWRKKRVGCFFLPSLVFFLLTLGFGAFMYVFAIDSHESELSGLAWMRFSMKVMLPLTLSTLLYRIGRFRFAAFLLLLVPVIFFHFSIVTGMTEMDTEITLTKSPGICSYKCCRADNFCVNAEFNLQPGDDCRFCTYERFCTGEKSRLKPEGIREMSSVTCTPT